jgi:hypothetical protein
MSDDLHAFTKGYGTGAVPRLPDARDFDLGKLPSVTGAVPDEVNLSQYCWVILNQGSLPACVAYSIAQMQSTYEFMDEKETLTFDGSRIYYENGGDGLNGIPTARVLKYGVDKGLPILASTQGRRLQSYAYTLSPDVVCQALAAKRLCVVASLLPSDWWDGDCYSMTIVPNTYHQYLITGYNRPRKRFYIANTWGRNWGINGFGSIGWDFLTQQNNQNGYVYFYATTDYLETQPNPVPVPTPVPVPVGRKITLYAAFQKLGGMRFVSVMARWADTNAPAVGVTLDAGFTGHQLLSQKAGSAGGAYWIFDSSFIGLLTITAHESGKPITGTTTLNIS